VIKPELKVYPADLMDLAPEVPDCSVDMIFTSYPYKKKDGYSHDLMQALGTVAGRVLRPGGRFFLNGGQLREGFTRPQEAQGLVHEWSGLEPGQTIAWIKSLALPGWRKGALERVERALEFLRAPATPSLARVAGVAKDLAELQDYLKGPGDVLQRGHYQPITMRSPTLNYCWEPVYTFFKPPELALNRLAIGCPFADKGNMRRGTRGKHGDLHCAGDTWWIPYKTTGSKAKKATAGMADAYSYPVELVERAVKVSNMAKGCVVFDPFMGSGTTAVAAKRLGMHAWGLERDARKISTIQQRWEREPVGDGQHAEEEEVDMRVMR
jgi:hypothetical protein